MARTQFLKLAYGCHNVVQCVFLKCMHCGFIERFLTNNKFWIHFFYCGYTKHAYKKMEKINTAIPLCYFASSTRSTKMLRQTLQQCPQKWNGTRTIGTYAALTSLYKHSYTMGTTYIATGDTTERDPATCSNNE
jgi:hypothetical protein